MSQADQELYGRLLESLETLRVKDQDDWLLLDQFGKEDIGKCFFRILIIGKNLIIT